MYSLVCGEVKRIINNGFDDVYKGLFLPLEN
jgi:hypothetical protein